MGVASKKRGRQTFQFANPPTIKAVSTTVGPFEAKGPLRDTFDRILDDDLNNRKTWEQAESAMLEETIQDVIKKGNLQSNDVDFLVAGDLLNQLVSSNFAARSLGIPFLGLFGACSSMAEGLGLGSVLIDGGFAQYGVAAASSHHETAERQFRFPTEMGVQRPLTAQWTVTGSGAALLANQGNGPRITHFTVGRVVDLGESDPNNMGGAMAPAAADTITNHFIDTGRSPKDYDLIITGDLANIGRNLAEDLVRQQGYDMAGKYTDCGLLIYAQDQDTHAGGSGCGCSAVVLLGHILQQMALGNYHRILFVGTGALLSPLTVQQGETIPCIGHGVVIEN